MKMSTNQISKTIGGGTQATRYVEPAKTKSTRNRDFERRFCEVLIALIFATVVLTSLVLTYLSSRLIERLGGPNGTGALVTEGYRGIGSDRSWKAVRSRSQWGTVERITSSISITSIPSRMPICGRAAVIA
jgi:hypothetical protein